MLGLMKHALELLKSFEAMNGKITLINERYFGGESVADIRIQYTKDLVAITIEGDTDSSLNR